MIFNKSSSVWVHSKDIKEISVYFISLVNMIKDHALSFITKMKMKMKTNRVHNKLLA